jgi:hypothetical protein
MLANEALVAPVESSKQERLMEGKFSTHVAGSWIFVGSDMKSQPMLFWQWLAHP